jgi:hypothetical protein
VQIRSPGRVGDRLAVACAGRTSDKSLLGISIHTRWPPTSHLLKGKTRYQKLPVHSQPAVLSLPTNRKPRCHYIVCKTAPLNTNQLQPQTICLTSEQTIRQALPLGVTSTICA